MSGSYSGYFMVANWPRQDLTCGLLRALGRNRAWPETNMHIHTHLLVCSRLDWIFETLQIVTRNRLDWIFETLQIVTRNRLDWIFETLQIVTRNRLDWIFETLQIVTRNNHCACSRIYGSAPGSIEYLRHCLLATHVIICDLHHHWFTHVTYGMFHDHCQAITWTHSTDFV